MFYIKTKEITRLDVEFVICLDYTVNITTVTTVKGCYDTGAARKDGFIYHVAVFYR